MNVNKREAENLIHWIMENKKMMEFTGSFNIRLMLPQEVIKGLQSFYGTGVEHYMYSPGQRTVRLLGMDLTPHPGTPRREHAVQLIAEGMNVTRANVTPITRSFSSWPIRANAKKLIKIMDTVKNWCGEKKSAYFQKSDVMRIGKCSAYVAYEAIRYSAVSGDVERCDRRWWYWPSLHNPMTEPRPRRAPLKNRFLDQYRNVQQLVNAGVVSQQAAVNALGIDYKKEVELMQREQMYRDNLAMSGGPLMGFNNIPKGAK